MEIQQKILEIASAAQTGAVRTYTACPKPCITLNICSKYIKEYAVEPNKSTINLVLEQEVDVITFEKAYGITDLLARLGETNFFR